MAVVHTLALAVISFVEYVACLRKCSFGLSELLSGAAGCSFMHLVGMCTGRKWCNAVGSALL